MLILFYEQVVSERDIKMEKDLLDKYGESNGYSGSKRQCLYFSINWGKENWESFSGIMIWLSMSHLTDTPIYYGRQLFIVSL